MRPGHTKEGLFLCLSVQIESHETYSDPFLPTQTDCTVLVMLKESRKSLARVAVGVPRTRHTPQRSCAKADHISKLWKQCKTLKTGQKFTQCKLNWTHDVMKAYVNDTCQPQTARHSRTAYQTSLASQVLQRMNAVIANVHTCSGSCAQLCVYSSHSSSVRPEDPRMDHFSESSVTPSSIS